MNGNLHFEFTHMLNLFKFLMFCAMDILNVTEDSSLCNSTPMNLLIARDRLHLEQEERVIARLQHWRQRKEDQSRPSQG